MKPISKRRLDQALARAGCVKVSETGIHEKWACPDGDHTTAVPRHREIPAGTLRNIIGDLACLPKGMAPVTTTATTTYTARCTREGKWWVIHVPEIDHSTQARRLDQVPETVADLVSLFTDLDPADVTVQVTVAWPEALAARVAEVEAARADAEARAAAAADLRLALAADLTREGLSVRDVARVLGVSHQRVAQLLQPDSAEPAPGGTAQPDREMTSAQPKTTRLTQEDRRTNTTSRAGGRPARGPG